MCNFFVLITFNVMQEENHFFGGWQLHHGTLQMYALYVAADNSGFSTRAAVQCKRTDRRDLTDFGQKRLVNLLGPGFCRRCKRAQERVAGKLLSGEFVVCHPESQGVNSVAMLTVNLIVFRCAIFDCGSK